MGIFVLPGRPGGPINPGGPISPRKRRSGFKRMKSKLSLEVLAIKGAFEGLEDEK
jgi:hypothetical protein